MSRASDRRQFAGDCYEDFEFFDQEEDPTLIDYSPFHGDGRKKFKAPEWSLPSTDPIPVTNAQARDLIDRFLQHGSNHSGAGNTLWVLLVWCALHKVPYTLKAWPGMGYEMTKLETP